MIVVVLRTPSTIQKASRGREAFVSAQPNDDGPIRGPDRMSASLPV